MAQRSILEEIMRRRRTLEKRVEQGKYATRGEEGRSTATDQNTVLRVRAKRGEEWSEHVDEQVGEGRKTEELTGDGGQKRSLSILLVIILVVNEVMQAKIPRIRKARKRKEPVGQKYRPSIKIIIMNI